MKARQGDVYYNDYEDDIETIYKWIEIQSENLKNLQRYVEGMKNRYKDTGSRFDTLNMLIRRHQDRIDILFEGLRVLCEELNELKMIEEVEITATSKVLEASTDVNS